MQNNPGGGGLVTANRLYFNAEKDGSVLAKLERAVPQLAIQGNPNAQFDPAKFTWLGSLSSYANDAYLMLVNADHPAKTVDDLKTPGMSVDARAPTMPASTNLIFAVIAKEVLGLNVNVVRGYTGAAPLFLAMQSGELDGQMVGLSSVRTGQRDLWNKKALSAAHGFRPRPRGTRNFPDLPIGRELTNDPDALALIEFAELPFFMALPFAAPPDLPADRAAALQTRVHGDVPGQRLRRRGRETRHRHEPDRRRRNSEIAGPHGGHAEGRDRPLQRHRWRQEVGLGEPGCPSPENAVQIAWVEAARVNLEETSRTASQKTWRRLAERLWRNECPVLLP